MSERSFKQTCSFLVAASSERIHLSTLWHFGREDWTQSYFHGGNATHWGHTKKRTQSLHLITWHATKITFTSLHINWNKDYYGAVLLPVYTLYLSLRLVLASRRFCVYVKSMEWLVCLRSFASVAIMKVVSMGWVMDSLEPLYFRCQKTKKTTVPKQKKLSAAVCPPTWWG